MLVGSELERYFHIPEVRLVNDFAANGFGVLTLRPSEVVTIVVRRFAYMLVSQVLPCPFIELLSTLLLSSPNSDRKHCTTLTCALP